MPGTDRSFESSSIKSIYFGGCAFGAAFYIGVYKSMWDLWGPEYFETTLVGGDSVGCIFAIAIGLRKPPEYLHEMYKRVSKYRFVDRFIHILL